MSRPDGRAAAALCVATVMPCADEEPDPLAPYRGLGTWVDAYDFSRELRGRVRPDAVDDMARQGVKTLYIQAAKDDRRVAGDLLSPDLLGEWLRRAHDHGIRVVAWYLPKFVSPAKDWRLLQAIAGFEYRGHRFDAIGVDIEERAVGDVRARSERLIELSRKLRQAVPDLALAAIVIPPVLTDEINPAYWPNLPWRQIAPYYDVWIPMAYWTDRRRDSGYRDAYRYVSRNVELLRQHVGDPDAVVHVAGGIGNKSTTSDYEAFVRAAHDGKAVGLSSYDYATTHPSAWASLRKGPS